MPTIQQLEKFLATDPNDPFVLYGLAQAHAKENNHTQAVHFYDRCIEANPDECYAYYHKALSLITLQQQEQAAQTLRTGLETAQRLADTKAAGEINALLSSL